MYVNVFVCWTKFWPKILSIFLAGFLAGIMLGIFDFTAGISLLHSIFLLRILPEFLLI